MEARVSVIACLAIATGALVAPMWWILVCALVGLIVGVDMDGGPDLKEGRRRGSADFIALPARGMGRLVRAVTSPTSIIKGMLLLLLAVAVGFLLAAAAGGLVWLLHYDSEGLAAAARVGAMTDGPRVIAAVLCFLLLRGTGQAASQRSKMWTRHTRRLTEPGLTAVGAIALIFTAWVVAFGPRLSGGPLTGVDGLGLVPSAIHEEVDGLRDDLVLGGAERVAECLYERQGVLWSASFSIANPVEDPDVVRLTSQPGEEWPPVIGTTAALALHNFLPPWVELVEIAHADGIVFAFDRRLIESHEPLFEDVNELLLASTAGQEWLRQNVAIVDPVNTLTCSAPSIF
ncbi:MAG TPA: hypothetical protein VK988_18810 [Acidimicrobiales bacterium]|nr:hypothetical protein [Acidimicrobiales bacterium]